tara:strand:+ start:417 stop:617 length:201 start_codon:yes stop_codon:yes gene_type:complete
MTTEIKIQMELEEWLLSKIKKIGNTPESSGRGEKRYNTFIEGYKEMVLKRPLEMKNYQVCKDFHKL